ncbi:TasA family protein [Ornithinibacillus salinisoli]|uniref:TasA family protein n=1 Tax=Ornithinibacillus salinisoli TaxID=1848459 RepID=A0ABW4W092_9BACI
MKRILILCLMFIIGFTVISDPAKSFADESNADDMAEIDISLSPSDVLFNIDNMKPGDWAERNITIKNAGEYDFEYQMSIRNEGSEKLFNEFLLEIRDSNDELYTGKLADFEKLPVREITSTNEEELEITVRFPEHLGNEFQGLDAQFTFIFVAEGAEDTDTNDRDEESVDGSVGSDKDNKDGGSILPDTATNMFNLLLIGSILLVTGVVIAASSAIKRVRKNNKQHV